MHSGHTSFSEELRSLPAYPSQIPHQDLSFSQSPSRPGRLSSYRLGAEWNLGAPSDADLDNEQHLPAALSRGAELKHNKLHHSPHLHSSPIPVPMPIPVPPSTSPPQKISVSPAAMFLAAFSPAMAPAPLPDDEGQIVAGYTLDGIIGYGGSSIIRRAFSASGGVVAVKIVKRSDIQKQPNPDLARRKLQREAEVWSSLSHEHILPLFSAVHTSYADFFVTLFCPAGSMYDILQRDGTPALPQDDAGMMFRQVVRGLRYLHEVAMYVHRDIKLENVLVDEMGVCRIGDFGMSRKIGEIDDDDLEPEVEEEYEHDPFHHPGNIHRAASTAGITSRRETRSSLQPSSAIARHNAFRHRNSTSSTSNPHPVRACQPGSLPYAAPELLLPQTGGPLPPHPAQDIWALGVLLYALLTGRFPFHDSFEPRLQMKILHGTFELPVGTGKGAERVFKGCLERSTQQRWSIDMVDEVAWGIGWGSEGDDVTPTESDEEYETHCRPSTRPASRSCSRPPAVVVPILDGDSPQQEDGRTRPAREAASRRSASRAKRSQSRAPVPTHHHQPYSGRSLSRGVITRHNSRAPSPTSAGSPLSASIMSSTESPFLASPTSSIDRGRRLFRQNSPLLPSRSPSPSVVPGTPVDFGAPFNISFSASLPVVNDQPDEPDELRLDRVEEEEKRGRSKATRDLRVPPLSFSSSDNSDNDNLNVDVGHWGGNPRTATGAVGNEDNSAPYNFSVDSDKERSRSCGFSLRALSPSPRSSRGPPRVRHSYHHHHYAHEPYEYDHEFWMKKKEKEMGSHPPTPATPSSTPWAWSTAQSLPISAAAINEFLKNLAAPPADPVEMMRRGRSVDRGIGWS